MRTLCLCIALAACGTERPVDEARQAIIGGQPIARGQFPSLVGLIGPSGATCTGALIGPDVVLTAAHCLQPLPPGIPNDEAVAANTLVFLDAIHLCGPDRAARQVAVRRILRHPDFVFPMTPHDVGVVWLAEEIGDRAPLPVNLDPAVAPVGAPVTVVGFGVTDAQTFQGCEGHVLTDVPVGDCAMLAATSNAEELCLDQSGGQGICAGDSGSPILAELDGISTVVAVTSGGDVSCAVYGRMVRTAHEAAFIREILGVPVVDAGVLDAGAVDAEADAEVADAQVPDTAPDARPDLAPEPDGSTPTAAGDDGCQTTRATRSGAIPLLLLLAFALRRGSRKGA